MSSLPVFDETYEEVPSYRGFFLLRVIMRKIIKITGVFAFTSLLIATSFISFDFVRTRQAFPAKTFIGSVDVSSLTQNEALAKLKDLSLTEAFTSQITLEANGMSFSFLPQELGLYILHKESVRNAFKITHQDNYLQDLKSRLETERSAIPLLLSIDEDRVKRVLVALVDEVHTSPKDASILYYEETGGYHVESEVVGMELNISKSMGAFKNALAQGKTVVPLIVSYTDPRITEKTLRDDPPVYHLAAYTTYYGKHDSPNRIHNIKLVASWIDDTLLMPGERFSVVEALGDVIPGRGFKRAFVIVGGELVPLLGGGSCQIATTLFNAVALADLKILQRRNHSFYFNIYPLGRDAGVYPGQLDFRFENDSGHPILIKTVATNKRLSFRIYGTPSGKTVKFSGASIVGRSRRGWVPMSLRQVIAWDVPFKTFVKRKVFNSDGEFSRGDCKSHGHAVILVGVDLS